ncbi:LOXH1 protein, partial [Rhadina sibilatrix]|nr:LOXH1 protein [Rhadina sibilatrix]
FPCERWLAKSEDDGETVRELVPSDIFTEKLMKDGTLKQIEEEVEEPLEAVINDEQMMEDTTYTLQVKTSDIGGAGTDANVSLILFGEYGDSGILPLKESNKSNKFERNQMDEFSFSEMLSLGDLCKVRIWHDNKGIAPGWHLEYIDVMDSAMDKTFRFQCDRWLAKGEDDGQLIRELACANNDILELKERTVKYETIVVTGFEKGAGTDANVFITIYGLNGDSGRRALKHKFRNLFERGKTNRFYLETLDMGELKKVRIEHDNSGLAPGWLVERVEI